MRWNLTVRFGGDCVFRSTFRVARSSTTIQKDGQDGPRKAKSKPCKKMMCRYLKPANYKPTLQGYTKDGKERSRYLGRGRTCDWTRPQQSHHHELPNGKDELQILPIPGSTPSIIGSALARWPEKGLTQSTYCIHFVTDNGIPCQICVFL